MHGRVLACSRSTVQQTATTAVGVELGSDDGLDRTIGFDGSRGSRDRRSQGRDRNEAIVPQEVGGQVALMPLAGAGR
jgi:hypothetical protein